MTNKSTLYSTIYTVLFEWMSMEHWWNYTNRNRLKYQAKTVYYCRIFHRKTRMYRPGIESGRPQLVIPHSQKSIQKK